MVQMAGTYALQSNENVVKFMTDIGVSADKAKAADEQKPTLTITVDGNKIGIASTSPLLTPSNFTLGAEYDETMPTGAPLKSVAKQDGNKLIINSKAADGRTLDRVYEFSDDKLVVKFSSSASSVTALRHYKKS